VRSRGAGVAPASYLPSPSHLHYVRRVDWPAHGLKARPSSGRIVIEPLRDIDFYRIVAGQPTLRRACRATPVTVSGARSHEQHAAEPNRYRSPTQELAPPHYAPSPVNDASCIAAHCGSIQSIDSWNERPEARCLICGLFRDCFPAVESAGAVCMRRAEGIAPSMGREAFRIPVFMADPPSSAISNWNPPRKIGTYSSCRVSLCVADRDACSCGLAEFSSRWRTRFSHLRGGS
jgi:hypothetical protein